MPKFKGTVRGHGYLTVEAEDEYAADEVARNMTRQDMIDAVQWSDIEPFPEVFPEEI